MLLTGFKKWEVEWVSCSRNLMRRLTDPTIEKQFQVLNGIRKKAIITRAIIFKNWNFYATCKIVRTIKNQKFQRKMSWSRLSDTCAVLPTLTLMLEGHSEHNFMCSLAHHFSRKIRIASLASWHELELYYAKPTYYLECQERYVMYLE